MNEILEAHFRKEYDRGFFHGLMVMAGVAILTCVVYGWWFAYGL